MVATIGGGLQGGAAPFATMQSDDLADVIIDNKAATFGEIKEQFETTYPSTKKQPFSFVYYIDDEE